MSQITKQQKNQTLERTSKALKRNLTCKLCHELYKSPKTLPCLHSFCSACIDSRRQQSEKMTCPECNKEALIQDNELGDLPDAFIINRELIEYNFLKKVNGEVDVRCEKCAGKSVKAISFCESCAKFICELCVTIHRSWLDFASHKVLSLTDLKENYHKYVPDPKVILQCSRHSKECTIYCETCKTEICHDCIIKSHRNHSYNLSVDCSDQRKLALREQLEELDKMQPELENAISKLVKVASHMTQMGASSKDRVKNHFEGIRSLFSKRQKDLTEELQTVVDRKVYTLEDQKSSIEYVKEQITSCQKFVSKVLASNATSEFFALEHSMVDRIAEVTAMFKATNLTPVEEPEVCFNYDKRLPNEVASSTQVSDGSVLHVARGEGRLHSDREPVFILNEIVTFYIALSSSFHKIRDDPGEKVSAEIKSVREGSVAPATVAISNSGFAKIQCSFAERGRYSLNVCIDGHHIYNSPCNFFVQPSASHFHTTIRSITKVSSPSGIAVNNQYQMVVSQESAHAITVFGRKLRKVHSFGTPGSEKGQFNQPSGVAINPEGFIYVSDSKNNRVQKFDAEGNYVSEFTGEKSDCNRLNTPTGIKVKEDGNVYVVDRGNKRVVTLNSKLEYQSVIGSEDGRLNDPWDVAFDSNNFIYITDIKLHSILIYSPSGQCRGHIGCMGSQKGRLNRPSGIVIDRFGRIFVSEFGNHRVSVFHVNSEFIDCFSAGLSMVNPCSLDIDEDGFVYVASSEAIHVF